jgi:DNA-binding NtrC family response regulator
MKKNILIVEDEYIVAQDLEWTLENAGYTITGIAASVEQARGFIRAKKPSLVLLDIMLNGNDTGIHLAKELKEANIAFVYLSANSNKRTFEMAKATEPYGFLVKPFREPELLMMLDIALYRHEKSLESEWNSQQRFEKALKELAQVEAPLPEKLQTLAKHLQAFLSFDLVSIQRLKFGGVATQWYGVHRTGFEEYQFIDEAALKIITGSPHHPQLLQKKYSIASTTSLRLQENPSIILQLDSKAKHQYGPAQVEALSRVQTFLQNAIVPLFTTPMSTTNAGDIASNATPEALSAHFPGIVGNSPSWLQVLDLVTRVAPVDSNVLLLGESGTGKEGIAESIHRLSPRRDQPLVKLNCAALPANLIESELFGHEKGAFTDASRQHIGKFEQAQGGTLFLDEIGELPIQLQSKLLRVLQSREIERLGGNQPIRIDVRVIAATNKHLPDEMAAGRFRLDLYYRLNVFPILLPPLRERKEDVPALAQHFANTFAQRLQRPFTGISEPMMEQLLSYDFPGNIRELANVIERAVILSSPGGPLRLAQPIAANPLVTNPAASAETLQTIEDVRRVQKQTEADHIRSILAKTRGRIRGKGGAAELLDEKPTTLESRMQRLGIKKEDFR